jgi:hypothetical protein
MIDNEHGSPITSVLWGLGNIGLLYDLENTSARSSAEFLTHAKALCASLRFELLAGIDLKKQNRKLFSSTYGLPAFSKLDELPNVFPLDLLIVALPTEIQVKECLRLKGDFIPRNLLIEKPVGISSVEAKQLLNWAQSNKVSVFVNYFRNRFESVALAKEALVGFNFGRVDKVQISSYGSLRNIYSHFLELSEYLLPGQVICGCPKNDIRISSTSSLLVMCTACSRLYEFEGINSDRRETSVVISGEVHQLRILNNGRDIHLESSLLKTAQSFFTDSDDFNRYQLGVYEKIHDEIISNQISNDLIRAIQVQEFIDGIE